MSEFILKSDRSFDKLHLFSPQKTSNYSMTVIGDSLNHSQINTSPTKAAYKFSKTKRFPKSLS